MAKINEIDITSLLWQEGSAPSTPASTKWRLYFKTDGIYIKDDAGTETGPLAAAAAGLGAWTDYTPSWTATTTNPTLGSSTIAGRYKALDAKTLAVQINVNITTGGAWNAGSGTYIFGLPAGATGHASRIQVGSVVILDSGTTFYAGSCKVDAGATTISAVVVADQAANRLLAHNAPVTWASGDQILISWLGEIQ